MKEVHSFLSSSCAATVTIIIKIVHMVLLWSNAVPDSKRAKLDEPLKTVKRSLEFLTSRDMECVPSVPPSPLVLLSF